MSDLDVMARSLGVASDAGAMDELLRLCVQLRDVQGVISGLIVELRPLPGEACSATRSALAFLESADDELSAYRSRFDAHERGEA